MTVHKDVAVVDDLARSLTGVTETGAIANIVQTGFKQLEKDHTGHTTTPCGFFVVTAELLLEHAVLEAELLLFAKCDGVFALLLATGAHTVLTGRKVATLKRLGRAKECDAKTAADLGTGTCVTSHVVK